MKVDQAHSGQAYWRYDEPAPKGVKILLLTVGAVAVIGVWEGEPGEHFIAWSPLPKRNKEKETALYFRAV